MMYKLLCFLVFSYNLAISMEGPLVDPKIEKIEVFFNNLLNEKVIKIQDKRHVLEFIDFLKNLDISGRENYQNNKGLLSLHVSKFTKNIKDSIDILGHKHNQLVSNPKELLKKENRMLFFDNIQKVINMLNDIIDSIPSNGPSHLAMTIRDLVKIKTKPISLKTFQEKIAHIYYTNTPSIIAYKTGPDLRELERSLHFYIQISHLEESQENRKKTISNFMDALNFLRLKNNDICHELEFSHKCKTCWEPCSETFVENSCIECSNTTLSIFFEDLIENKKNIPWIENQGREIFQFKGFSFNDLLKNNIFDINLLVNILHYQIETLTIGSDWKICSNKGCYKPIQLPNLEELKENEERYFSCPLCDQDYKISIDSSLLQNFNHIPNIVTCQVCNNHMERIGGCLYLKCKTCGIPYNAEYKEPWTKEFHQRTGKFHKNMTTESHLQAMKDKYKKKYRLK